MRDRLDVSVDVLGADVGPAPAGLVREQLVAAAAAPLERLHDLEDLGVDDRLLAPLAALRRVVEPDEVGRGQRDVLLAHGRQPVRVVRLGVVLAADAEEAAVKKAHGAGEHALLVELGSPQVALHAPPQLRQAAGEPHHLVELLLVAPLAPLAVVDVLLAAAGVDAGGLDVAHRKGTDPDVLPGGRDDELADALEHLGILDAGSVLIDVFEPATTSAAADAGRRAVHSA